MKCPKCGSSMMSIVTSTQEVDDTVQRLRKCTVCEHKYVTVEKFDRELRWTWKNRHTKATKGRVMIERQDNKKEQK